MFTKKMSTGESIVMNYVVAHGYRVLFGKSFSFLDGMHGDVFIPASRKNPVKTIIEYDGVQHFIGWDKRDDSLNQNVAHDMKKNLACLEHSVHIIRLEDMKSLSTKDYPEAIKRVDKILDEELPARTHGISVRFVSLDPKLMKNKIKLIYNDNVSGTEPVAVPSNIVSFVEGRPTVTVSQLQTRFTISYNHAKAIMAVLVKRGIVTKKDKHKPRRVLVRKKNHRDDGLDVAYFYKKIASDEVAHDIIKNLGKYKTMSTSKLERIYGIGYKRATKIMDYLTAKRMVTKPDGIHPRQVLVKRKRI